MYDQLLAGEMCIRDSNMAYRILGVLDDSHKTTWAEATEKSIGKHIGFLFNGVILTAPYVNLSLIHI